MKTLMVLLALASAVVVLGKVGDQTPTVEYQVGTNLPIRCIDPESFVIPIKDPSCQQILRDRHHVSWVQK